MAERAPTPVSEKRTPAPRTRRLRWLVLAVALVAAAVKLLFAAKTWGTNDIYAYQEFAQLVRSYGVVKIYGLAIVDGQHGHRLYNHPPLIGWLLLLLSHVSDLGISFRFLIRVPATVADVITSVLVFELVRIRRSLGEAAIAGVLVACSPALIVISGFHGNTDPVFVMFAILSLYLLVTGRSGILAGISFAAAISIKIIPIAALPVLLLIAWRAGRRRMIAFVAGFAATMAALWLPVVATEWHPFAKNVLGYKGLAGKWGLVEFATNIVKASPHTIRLLTGPGRWPLLLISAGLPLYIAWRRPSASIPAFGLSLVLVLLLSTASSGGRYLAWAIAAAFLVDVPTAVLYNIGASVLVITVYNRWNGGWPWDRALPSPWTHVETLIAALTWFTLLAVAVRGVLTLRAPAPAADERTSLDISRAEGRLATSDVN